MIFHGVKRKSIQLKGVKQNNLKNINLDIPIGKFVVVCGPSGSGKSSLAFETLYAEGQRRYIESLSNYSRQFLQAAPKPDIESIENIPPAIAIEQKNHVKTSRSTVGTTTEIHDYLRLLFAKIGEARCPHDNSKIIKDSISKATKTTLKNFDQKRVYILCPVDESLRVLKSKKLLEAIIKQGFVRIFIPKNNKKKLEGEILDLTLKSKLPKTSFYILIDRLAISKSEQGRLADSLRTAYQCSLSFNSFTGGRALILSTDGDVLKFSEDLSCSICDFVLSPISSSLFSYSSPVGACRKCNGFGDLLILDPNKVIPNPKLTIAEGAIAAFNMPSTQEDFLELKYYCKKAKIDIHTSWKDLPQKHQTTLWEGNDTFYGIQGFFDWLETKKYKMHIRMLLARYKSPSRCPNCQGSRLTPDALQVFIGGKNIRELSFLSLEKLFEFFDKLKLSKMQKEISHEIYTQIQSRLKFLLEVGVHYLSLIRTTKSLSGGEFQRIKLANQLGMGLSQTLYVLDEPTIGLHPRDNLKLISVLRDLKDLGNTLVIVEHDHDVINNSDHIIEMGPGSGYLGGEVLFSDTKNKFLKFSKSNTSGYIKNTSKVQLSKGFRATDSKKHKYYLELIGCKGNNLKNIDLKIPLHRFVAITGVSGSGKSSLIEQTLYPAIARELKKEYLPILDFNKIKGIEFVNDVLFINQKSVGRSSRSNPATYMGIYDEIRSIFSNTQLAQSRSYKPGFFSLNVDGGRCPVCKGEGVEVIDMQFMDDIVIECDNCKGTRFKKEILDIKFQGKNIHQVLNMSIHEASEFFVQFPKIRKALQLLTQVGLDYIQLGQSALSLSGGESQRLKIAKELSTSKFNACLYILDEPTTGLHFREIELLLKVLQQLVDAGGSVLVIEHNLDIIRRADYIVDIGPEGGEQGGNIIYSGEISGITKNKKSHTAKFLLG